MSGIFVQRLGHAPVLGNEVHEFLVGKGRPLAVENVQPFIRHLGHGSVTLGQRRAFQEELEDLLLEDLDELELASSLDFEALQLGKAAVVVEHGIPLFQVLVLLLRGGKDHGPVRAVDLEEDGVVAMGFVSEGLGIHQGLVLVVGELAMDQMVQHGAGVGDGQFLAVLELEGKILGERGRKHAPDAVRVEFQGPAESLDQRPGHLDDGCSRQARHARHFHRVPARAFPHDVSVEGVQNDLVRQLQGVEKHDHLFGVVNLGGRGARLPQGVGLPLPDLCLGLVLVAPVAKVADSVDVEGVLPLADDGLPDDGGRLTDFVVDLLRVELEPLFGESGLLVGAQVLPRPHWAVGAFTGELFVLQGIPDHVVLVALRGQVLAPPSPGQSSVAVLPRAVEVTSGAVRFRDHRVWLQPIRGHDVGVHGRDIEVVNQGPLLAVRGVLEVLQPVGDLLLDLVVVEDVVHRFLLLHRDAEGQGRIQVAEELVNGAGIDGKVLWDIRPEDARFDTLDVAANVGLGIQKMPLPEGLFGRNVLVREHNAVLVGLHHEEHFAERSRALSEGVIGAQGQDRAQREDEGMDVFHVEVVGCDGIGNRVLGQGLGPLARVGRHEFRVELVGVVSELRDRDGLETTAALGQVAVTVHPVEAVHVDAVVALVLVLAVLLPPDLVVHVDAVYAGTSLDEGPVKEVTVVGGDHGRPGLLDVEKEALEDGLLVGLVEDHERPRVLGLGSVIEVGDVL